jgi:hypothetical protein
MINKIKKIVWALPLLLSAVATSAHADYYNPDGGDTGGCSAIGYGNGNYSFNLPDMAGGQTIEVWGTVAVPSGSGYYLQSTSAYFTCNGGWISGGVGYPGDDWWG